MAFHHYRNISIQISDVISTIIAQLVANGWSQPDPGYDVVQNPGADFDIHFYLGANNRWVDVEIGYWNAVSHAMDAGYIKTAFIFHDNSSGYPTGTELGELRLSYDDDHVKICTDWKSINGGSYRLGWGYLGLMISLKTGDEMIGGGFTHVRGSYATPTYDTVCTCGMRLMKNISGALTKPGYSCMAMVMAAQTGLANAGHRGQIYSATFDKRLIIPIYLASLTGIMTGGENAGIRGRLIDVCYGYNDDVESAGTTLESEDGKEYVYFIAADTVSYAQVYARAWIRIA
jgi:hypothetical protein